MKSTYRKMGRGISKAGDPRGIGRTNMWILLAVVVLIALIALFSPPW